VTAEVAEVAEVAVPARVRAVGKRVPRPVETPWTLDRLGLADFEIRVFGQPAPKGSKQIGYRRDGTPYLREDSADLKAWMKAVKDEAAAALPAGWEKLDGQIIADQTFTFARGTTIPQWKDYPTTEIDTDKLARAVNDALTQAGVWIDDKRLVDYRIGPAKVYALSGAIDALPVPGAVIRLWRRPEDEITELKTAARKRAHAHRKVLA
jgi:Holliday junction resolvase RusA-like endonuclease